MKLFVDKIKEGLSDESVLKPDVSLMVIEMVLQSLVNSTSVK